MWEMARLKGMRYRPMVRLALVKNGGKRAAPRACDLPLQADVRSHATASMCEGFNKADRLPECRLCESAVYAEDWFLPPSQFSLREFNSYALAEFARSNVPRRRNGGG
jgi:hypothetical protein